MTSPPEVRLPLARPDHFLILRVEPLTTTEHTVTVGVYRVFGAPLGEHRHLVSSVLSLTAADGDVVLATLAAAGLDGRAP